MIWAPCVHWVSQPFLQHHSVQLSVKVSSEVDGDFGSSLVFVWLRLWHWYGYSLVTVQEFGLSNVLLAMPLVVRRWAASLKAIPHFALRLCKRRGIKNATVSGFDLPLWDREMRFVTGHHQPGVCDSVTPPWHLQMIDSSAGQGSAQEWRGSGVRGRGHRELEHILAPERTNSIIFLELCTFKAREGLHILTLLFLFFFSEVLVLSLRKSPSEVSIQNKVTY